jgi:hypothetical protein
MQSRIVKCECGTNVYVAWEFAWCPVCRGKIRVEMKEPLYEKISSDPPYFISPLVPLQTVLKFFPTDLRYFKAEYPKAGQTVFIIKDNKEVMVDVVWTKAMQKDYEKNINDHTEPKIFYWLIPNMGANDERRKKG